MRARIEEVLSGILSRKYDANIKITFKERTDEQRRDHNKISGVNSSKRRMYQAIK